MEGNLLLALRDIKEIIDRLEQRILTMYDYPTDPVVRFLEYGLAMEPRDIKRATWLASVYKGTIHVIYILEEFAAPIISNDEIMYYQQYIKIKEAKYYIDYLNLVPYDNINKSTYWMLEPSPPNSTFDPMTAPIVHYYPQNRATYTLDIQIEHVYSKTNPINFFDYFIEYIIHMMIVNKVNIYMDKYIMILDYIEIIIDILSFVWKRKIYGIYSMIRNYY